VSRDRHQEYIELDQRRRREEPDAACTSDP
jgi:hypothetical protein